MADFLNILLENSYFIVVLKAILGVIFILISTFILNIYFKRLTGQISRRTSVEEKRLKKTRLEFLRGTILILIYLVAVIFVLLSVPGFKTFSYSLLAGAGIIAIVIGFAAQKTLANIIGGVSIVIYAPFRVGDKLKVLDENGEVEELNLRHTIIRTWDNRRIIIPNALMAEEKIVNYSLKDDKLLWHIDMGISYDSNIDKAKKIMAELANKHPYKMIFEAEEDGEKIKKEPYVRVTACQDFSVNLRLYFWAENISKAYKMAHELIEQIKKEFDKKGIEIPFPYRTIVYKKDLEKKKREKGIK